MVQTSGDYARTDASWAPGGYVPEDDAPQTKRAADWEAQADADAAMRRKIRFLGRRVDFLEQCARDSAQRLTQLITTLQRTGIIVDAQPGEGGAPESLAETIAHAADARRFTGR